MGERLRFLLVRAGLQLRLSPPLFELRLRSLLRDLRLTLRKRFVLRLLLRLLLLELCLRVGLRLFGESPQLLLGVEQGDGKNFF